MILLRDRQFFLLPFQGAVTWVVRKPRVPLVTLALPLEPRVSFATLILPWAKFLLPLWGVHRQMRTHVVVFHDNKDNTIGALTANSIPVRNWKSVKKRRKKPWKSVNFLCFIPWKSVKKRRKKPWKSVICRSLCPVYKQNIAIYIITRTITDVHGRHGELLYDSSCVSYFR